MNERTYSEEEMAAMLERAAKLQANAAKHAENRPGLTLSELEVIAAEAGLDPIHLKQAATELNESDAAISHRNVSTGASHNFVDQWVVGDLSDESWEEVVSELRHRYDSDLGQMMSGGYGAEMGYGRGHASQIGMTREWKHMSMSGIETRVIIQPRGESLQVKLSQRVGWGSTTAESITYGVATAAFAAMIAGAIIKSVPISFLVLISALVAAVPLIFYADKAWRKKKHRELEKLADRLAGILTNHSPIVSSSMTYEDEDSARIDASLLNADEEFGESEQQRSRDKTT